MGFGAPGLGGTVEISEIESLAKGTIIAGDGAGAPATLAVGADGTVLTADSAEATGLKWAAAGVTIGNAVTSGTANRLLFEDSSNNLAESASLTYTEAGASGNTLALSGGTLTSGGTNDRVLDLSATLNDTGAAGGSDKFTLIQGDITQTDVTGWDNVYLMDLMIDGASVLQIDNAGQLTLDTGLTYGTTTGLMFGDGDTGFYETSDDQIIITLGGTERFHLVNGQFQGFAPASFGCLSEGSSATNPTLLPNKSDLDTGIGQSGLDQLSLIAGGVEHVRLDVTGNHIVNSLLDAATGNEVALSLNYTTNKLTSGNDTGLLINQTDTASPGTSLLLDLQVGGVPSYSFGPALLTFADAVNMAFNTTTGTQIGTATTQKLGFWNVTPVVQQPTIVDADGTLADVTSKFNTALSQLEAIGLFASA